MRKLLVSRVSRRRALLYGSRTSTPATRSNTADRSVTVPAMRLMQSNERQAGTRPTVLISPRDGLNPAMPFSAGGTRPEPAVSVATVKGTSPVATASAEPELDPPEIMFPPKTLRGNGYGVL